MSEFVGMAPEKGDQLASRLLGSAREAEASLHLIKPIFTNLRDIWKGPDADRFIQRWESVELPALAELISQARQTAAAVQHAADAQRRTSGGW